jgi:hypothetical protein
MWKNLLEQRWPWLVVAAAIILAFLSTVIDVDLSRDRDRRPLGTADDITRLRERTDLNVLFILIDTLRADRLGSYGYERETSPEIDRHVSTGVRFARHLAQSSWTKCSMASLWTGLYPMRSGITRYDDVIPSEARLPAETLKEAGFQTVGLYRNGWVAPTFGFEQGFDVYTRPAARPLPPSVRLENPTIKARGTDEDAVAAAIEFLRVNGDERWFLYLHLMDVHEYLYDEETALFGGSYSDIYDNSIRWVDRVIGVLLAHLAERGHFEDTLVVIGSDHGEAFRERGYEGHARKVFRETTEVPFFLAFPFRLEPGVVVDVRTRNVDVWPTVLDLIGLESPPGIDGRSLAPWFPRSWRARAARRPPARSTRGSPTSTSTGGRGIASLRPRSRSRMGRSATCAWTSPVGAASSSSSTPARTPASSRTGPQTTRMRSSGFGRWRTRTWRRLLPGDRRRRERSTRWSSISCELSATPSPSRFGMRGGE